MDKIFHTHVCTPSFLALSILYLAFSGFSFAIKIDLRDGFYHIPLARSTQCHFGVLYDNTTYVFTRLPMGLKIAPSEMQMFSTAVAELVQSRFSVRCLAYLDDFLVLSSLDLSLSWRVSRSRLLLRHCDLTKSPLGRRMRQHIYLARPKEST